MTSPIRLRALAAAIVTVLVAGSAAAVVGPGTAAPEVAVAERGAWLGGPVGSAPDAIDQRPHAATTGSATDAVPIRPPDEFDGVEDTPVAAPPTTVAPATGTGTWAVVIGIDDYPGSRSDLGSAVNDARDFDLALDRFGVPAAQRRTLLDGAAGRDAIANALSWLTANAGPEATAVVFYAGHVRKVGRGSETIVGADGRTLSDDAFADRLAGLAADRTWIVMASCYGAGFDEALADGRILTAASGANELAYESSLYDRSYLVQFVIREAWLEGEAAGTVQAAFAHGSDRIADLHPGRVPVQLDRLGPLRLGPDPVRQRSEAAPAPSGGSTSPGTGSGTTGGASGGPGDSGGQPEGGSDPQRPAEPAPSSPPPDRNCTLSGLVEICE